MNAGSILAFSILLITRAVYMACKAAKILVMAHSLVLLEHESSGSLKPIWDARINRLLSYRVLSQCLQDGKVIFNKFLSSRPCIGDFFR